MTAPLRPLSWRVAAVLLVAAVGSILVSHPQATSARNAWVDETLAALSLDQRIGQLVMSGLDSTWLATDSAAFEALAERVERQHVGGFVVFGGAEPVPGVLLNPTYASVVLGNPLAAASTLNRLQRRAALPLLNSGDFEFGVGMRIEGATQFPRAMAFGAAGDERLAEEAGRITALEMRAIGVHVNFAPVADVNNNPRNPVINTRSFGEDPSRVGALAAAFVRGLQRGGVIATLKHFPGHGDTDVDTHLGLATVPHDRARLDAVELAPFRLAFRDAGAVMVGHLEMPAVEDGVPATFSRRAIEGLLRDEFGFRGLVITDALRMDAIAKMVEPGEAAVRALEAGNDVVLLPADDHAAVRAIREALDRGRLNAQRLDVSVRRVLEAKAQLGLHQERVVDLERVADVVGGRAHRAVADAVGERSITLVRDEGGAVPLRLGRTAQVLHLSVLDSPGGWRTGAPGRALVPQLRARWPSLTAIELSNRSTASEIELVRAMAPRFDAISVAVYARAASGPGRLELPPPVASLLRDLARGAPARPLVTTFFGNPYLAASLPDLPAVLLAYDLGDVAERSAVRAIAGEARIGGRLPIAIPGLASVGHGLDR
jgi:beta-N-acetylhexosaminidase